MAAATASPQPLLPQQHAPRPLLVLYGSQTGNAQDVADAVARGASARGYAPVRVLPMDAYPVAGLPSEPAVVFVASTTGQGDPPDNMRRFWRFLLRKSLAPGSLAGVRYAVFGLGDSAYVNFNSAAKKLDRRLAALGASPLVERGLGDDQHPGGYDAALDPWLDQLWAALRTAFPLPVGVAEPVIDEAARLRLGPAKFRVTRVTPPPPAAAAAAAGGAAAGPVEAEEEEETRLQREAVAAATGFRAVALAAAGLPPAPEASLPPQQQQQQHGPWRPFMAPLLVNRRLTAPDHFQDTRHFEFDLEGSGLSYEPGDLLAIFPRSPEADIQAMLQRLGLSGDELLRIEPAAPTEEGPPTAVVATARAIVQGVLDVSGTSPRRYLFQVLSQYTTEPREKERLAYFASPEGRDELYDYNQREKRTLLEVLSDFPSATPTLPLERLLEAAPLLQPRLFSISSSPLAHPGRAHVTAAIVRYATPFKRPKRGLLTTWLASLVPPAPSPSSASLAATAAVDVANGSGNTTAPAAGVAAAPAAPRVPVWVERGCLRLPANPSVPLLLVGPGTGVAPFRSFVWQRAALIAQSKQQQQQEEEEEEEGGVQPSPAASVLFFGCRAPGADFYYREEWGRLVKAGALDPDWGLVVAFSRPGLGSSDGGGGGNGGAAAAAAAGAGGGVGSGAKAYVSDKIREHGAQVWDLLSRGATIYVSGSAQKMPAGVASAFEEVARKHGGMGSEAAAKWVRQLQAGGRYFVEAWS